MARLARELAPLGCLAVQMPDNEDEPTHVLMREIAAEPRFRDKLAQRGGARARRSALSPTMTRRFRRFATRSTSGARSTSIASKALTPSSPGSRARDCVPLSRRCVAQERAAFLARYRAAIAGAYPPRAGGGVLLPFPRLFIVASRRAEALEGD